MAKETTITLLIALLGTQMTTQSSERPSGGKVVFLLEIINSVLLCKRLMYQCTTDFSLADG